jgi:hypothetical protein
MRKSWLLAGVLLACPIVAAEDASKPIATPGWRFEETSRFTAPEARQGVAADTEYLYVVSNHTLGKYRKSDGSRVATWEGGEDGPIIHLNAGTLVEGRLYCAHSNFPGVPMLSSVEIFDPVTLQHLASHSFGRTDGSLTWIQRRGSRWLACFVHYGRRGGEPGRGPSWSQVVEFDDEWRRLRAWTFPDKLTDRFAGYSCSGGAFGPGGYLYVTGHDLPELYVLEFPAAGSVLEWRATVPIAAEGQAFDWDPTQPNVLYSIVKRTREVIVGKVHVPSRLPGAQ